MLNGKHIYFLGYSGHAYVTMDTAIANGFVILGYFDRHRAKRNPFNLNYCGSENDEGFRQKVKEAYVFPAVGSNEIRKKLFQKLNQDGAAQLVLSHPSATVSSSASIGKSTLINTNASINSLVKIGNCCIINTGAIVEHECCINDFSHIAPGAVLAGNVHVGKSCFIGANAVIKQGISIADNVVVGAGAVVIKDITEKGTWVGNPAKLVLYDKR